MEKIVTMALMTWNAVDVDMATKKAAIASHFGLKTIFTLSSFPA